MKLYAGIGSRSIDSHVAHRLRVIAAELALEGWTPRTGDADGCDAVFREVARKVNRRILWNLAHHVRPGGLIMLSVMNLDRARATAKHRFSVMDEFERLTSLTPSTDMERTGDVWNPDLFLLDDTEGVIYRKEQFTAGTALPTEWIVRDRRFTKEQIETMCAECGLKVLRTRFVNAGWQRDLDREKAKEILVLCEVREHLPFRTLNSIASTIAGYEVSPDEPSTTRLVDDSLPAHDALADAKRQVVYVSEMWRKLREASR